MVKGRLGAGLHHTPRKCATEATYQEFVNQGVWRACQRRQPMPGLGVACFARSACRTRSAVIGNRRRRSPITPQAE